MKHSYRVWGTIVGVTFSLGFLLARALSHTVEDEDTTGPATAPTLNFYMDEHRYPPFSDSNLVGVEIDRTVAISKDQIAILGVPLKELQGVPGVFSLARCDGTSLWHPAVPKSKNAYSVVVEPYGDMAAIALPLTPDNECVVLGATKDGHFTHYRHQRLVALTTPSGLLYDFPNMPIIHIPS